MRFSVISGKSEYITLKHEKPKGFPAGESKSVINREKDKVELYYPDPDFRREKLKMEDSGETGILHYFNHYRSS